MREIEREIIPQPHVIAFPLFEGPKSVSAQTREGNDADYVSRLIQLPEVKFSYSKR